MNNQNGSENLRIELTNADFNASARRTADGRAPTYSGAELYGYQNEELSGGKKVTTFLGKSVAVTFKYFAAKTLASAVIGVGLYFVLCWLEVKYALIWALVAAIGNAIPVFGQWIGMAVCLSGVGILSRSWKTVLITVGALIVLQLLDEFVVTPLIVGKATSVKPILIIAVMLLASSFFGFWGVLFAVPAAAIIKLFYEIFLQRKKKS